MNNKGSTARPFIARFAQEFSGRQVAVGGHYNAAKQQRSWPKEMLSAAYPTVRATHSGRGEIDDEAPCD